MRKWEFIAANMRFLLRGGYRMSGAERPPAGHDVLSDFAGVCVAGSPDPACDEYVLHQLRAMNVRHVRVDYTYGSEENHAARLLSYLLEHKVGVLLHLVQPIADARRMGTESAQDRWRAFVSAALDRWGARVEAVEIGATVNRRKWAGYDLPTFMLAWAIAHDEARARGVRLAGPNVTDFEPVYNVALLAGMRAEGLLPDVHTDNLFAERATEPENYDHKILGRALASQIKFNVIKKARLLQRIAEWHGVSETWSTHVAWSKRRIDRLLPNVEEKQADYLARYMLLTAASGALGRVYWGPMIGQREGLIDDGTDEYPDPVPHVTLYERVYGEMSGYTVRPALRAMKAFADLIPGARYEGRLSACFGLEVHAFSVGDRLIHAAWTTNGRGADPASLYASHDLVQAQWIDRDGAERAEAPPLITESPCYIRWPAGRRVTIQSGAGPVSGLRVHRPVCLYRDPAWCGAVAAVDAEERESLLKVLAPSNLHSAERMATLRDARNAVWQISDPRRPETSLVVKRALITRWHKKVLDYVKPSKARRSWNGACELLRRGIDTPRPVAFFEQRPRAVLKENYYICAYVPGELSVRRYFTAYAAGETRYEGVDADTFYEILAGFLLNMHRRGVYFRDLSAGNILVLKGENDEIRFSLIDTARAQFFDHPISLRRRLSDLKRICHPLDWPGRKRFVGLYLRSLNEDFTPFRQCPFYLYDLKHRMKNRLKGKRKATGGNKNA